MFSFGFDSLLAGVTAEGGSFAEHGVLRQGECGLLDGPRD